mgnify:CR=1 FL=1
MLVKELGETNCTNAPLAPHMEVPTIVRQHRDVGLMTPTLVVQVMLDNHVERKFEQDDTANGGGGGGGIPVTMILQLFLRI